MEVETHPYEIVVRLEQDITPLIAQERRIFIKSTATTFYRINDSEVALNALPGRYEIGLMVGNWVAATQRVVVPWAPTMEWPSPSGSVSRSFLVRHATGKGLSIGREKTLFPDYTLTPLIGDVDGDGSPDLVLMDGKEMQIFDMSGRVVKVQLDSEARGGIIADLNGDGSRKS
ncbi:MAG: VCBS repeat-containing protein [Candidatus Korarchaeota archaeon]|nr:VCBS repeat-containing protein [Candidatus Korarchaeota archaeon]